MATMRPRGALRGSPIRDPDAYLASDASTSTLEAAAGVRPRSRSPPQRATRSRPRATRLGSHAAAAARRAPTRRGGRVGRERRRRAPAGSPRSDAVTLEATLDALHERVDRVAVVARDAGEALRRAESRRVAADDAVRLARHLVAFDACRNRERLRFAVDPVFFDEARAARGRAARAAAADARDGHARGGRRGGREPVRARVRETQRTNHRTRRRTRQRGPAPTKTRPLANVRATRASGTATRRGAAVADVRGRRARRRRRRGDGRGGGAGDVRARRLAGAQVRRDQADVHARREFRADASSTVAPDGEDPSSGREKNGLFQVRRRRRRARGAAVRRAPRARFATRSSPSRTTPSPRRDARARCSRKDPRSSGPSRR